MKEPVVTVVMSERAAKLIEDYSRLRGHRPPFGWQRGAKQLPDGMWQMLMPEHLYHATEALRRKDRGESFSDCVERVMLEAIAMYSTDAVVDGQHRGWTW